MSARALIIRPSSMGDIVHALPIVHDIAWHRPGIAIDWVAEEPFTSLVALNHGVNRVIPLALRRWRHRIVARTTWSEFGAFRRELRLQRYDVVLDLQEQIKGALIAWLARGPVHGPDRSSIREPAASLLYRHVYRIDPRQHLIDRCRQLAGKAFSYEPHGPPCFDLVAPALVTVPATRYAVCLHATSRADKLWPETHWRALIAVLAKRDFDIFLPWGNAEESRRSERLAEEIPGARVVPRSELPALAALLRGAALVCGIDTGLTHLAAALGTPTISLFVSTDPALAGVARASIRAHDLGGAGVVPTPAEVAAVADELLHAARA